MTCARDRWRIPAHREMLCGHGADVRFFLGKGNAPGSPDEILVDTHDHWEALPWKVRASLSWGLDHGYEWFFKCDADTWVDVPGFLASGFERFEYGGLMGDAGAGKGLAHCPSGGVGWWLSARAARAYLQHYPVYSRAHGGTYLIYEDWCLAIVMHDLATSTGDSALFPHHEVRLWNPILAGKFGRRELKDCLSWHGWDGRQEWHP